MNKKLILSTIGVLILAIGFFLYWQVRLLVNAVWKYAGFQIKNITADGISFYMFFNVDNPGLLALKVSEQNYNIFINGNLVSNVVNEDDQFIKSQDVSKLAFLINLKFNDLVKVGLNNIKFFINKAEREKIKIKIEGVLTLQLDFITIKKLKFSQESTLQDLKETSNSQPVIT